jgi:hypothetical protein
MAGLIFFLGFFSFPHFYLSPKYICLPPSQEQEASLKG